MESLEYPVEKEMLGRELKIDEFVSKTELVQSFQRHKPFQKLLVKFGIRNECCEILKVKKSLLSLSSRLYIPPAELHNISTSGTSVRTE